MNLRRLRQSNAYAMNQAITPHLPNAAAILAALADHNAARLPHHSVQTLAVLKGLQPWQQALLEEFKGIISQPAHDFISKTDCSWLVVGDRRRVVASEIKLVIEQHGVGIGLLVLHLQQLGAGHIPVRLTVDGVELDLAQPTRALHGERGEHVLQIPVRQFRADAVRLAEWGIAKPPALWDRSRIVSHERDGAACFFCSCAEINPAEVVVELQGARLGLDRDLFLGATFAPFGNPASVAHMLAWDRAPQPLSMSLAPGGVADLLRFTAAINDSIRAFFTARGLYGFPVLDGLSNGWAGNSIFHQHCQFFAPEFASPLVASGRVARQELVQRDDTVISRLNWPLPVYEIRSGSALRTAFVAHELAALWRFLGAGRKVPYKQFSPLLMPVAADLVTAHTQNLYAPGADGGRVLWFALRDREKVDFTPAAGDRVHADTGRRALPKKNLGVLEATGTWIVDDPAEFAELQGWSAVEISAQINRMLGAVHPLSKAVTAFESALPEVLPR